MPEQTNVNCYPAPAWLTADFVQSKLRIYFKDEQLKLQKLEVRPGTAKGENYASVMMRINVNYSTSEQEQHRATFLLKTTFADIDPTYHLLNQYGIYTREMDMYENVLPKLAVMLQKELEEKRKVFAATVAVDRARSTIIFEDLSLEHYAVACRLKRLNLAHARLTLEKLAQLHATAAVLNEREPAIFAKNFDRGFFNRQTRAYKPLMHSLLGSLISSIEQDEELRHYKKKLSGVCENIMEYAERTTDVNKHDFMTLVHGDVWTTNIMFNYDKEGQPANAILIDFQFSAWTSPAIDLHYFFQTSLQEELLLHHQTELVQFYYYKLAKALRQLKFTGHVPSLFDFQMQFQTRSFYGVFAALCFQPMMMYNGPEEGSIEKVIIDTEDAKRFKAAIYDAEFMQKTLRLILPIFDRKGLLDDMD